ncbi:MAG: outer membrane protein assembly factor [Caulobacteraceae bacterium]|nr:outer membrane protein assembly factor [Caulobacteraceae bacterium]
MILVALGGGASAAPRAEVRGVEDKSLKGLLQQVIGQGSPPTSRLEARRRAEDAAQQATAVLRSEGYYDGVVVPDIGDGDSPEPFVTVTPGPRSHILDTAIVWSGPEPDGTAALAAFKAVALPTGAPGRAADVVAAEGRIVAILQQQGYADAEALPREVVVDHADNTLHPTFHIRSGRKVRLGAVVVAGKARTRMAWVSALAPWKRGEVYRPKALAELERRLRDTGAYNQVAVALAPEGEGADGDRPVLVTLTERPKGALELGASYSTTEGAGVDSSWIVYNRLGLADSITSSAQLAQIDSRLQTQLSLPDWRKPDQTLSLTAALYRDNTPAYDLAGGGLTADLTHRYNKISFITYGASVNETSTFEKEAENFINTSQTRRLTTVALLGAFALDRSNDPLDPTQGMRLTARAEPTEAFGDGSIAYLKAEAQATAYVPLFSDGTVVAGRLKVGVIGGGQIPRVPAQDRFYSGGGGSVRGYGYQEVGPRYPDNTPEGGLSLVETSLELRQRLTQSWGVVAFIDTGVVGRQVAPDFGHPEVGVGLGVRYNLGFGPLRFDVGTPLERRQGDAPIQVYLSIGQNF